MDNKKHLVLLVGLVVLIIIFTSSLHRREKDSLAQFGLEPLDKSDCSSVKDLSGNSPVSVSFNAPKVAEAREKIKVLITKYNGRITNDAFNSYPGLTANDPNQDNASVTATFDKIDNEFLTELSSTIKSSGGVDSSYSYYDDQAPYGGGYSTYASCLNMMQTMQADILQLEVLVGALREEHDSKNISLLSQSISNTKSNLQSDISSLNSFLATSNKPSVSIMINSLLR